MAGQITITLPTGPGSSVSALVISSPSDVNFDLLGKVLTVRDSNGVIKEFDFASAATVTYTISGGNSTIAVSS